MKTKLIILLFLVISITFAAEYSFFAIPAFSPVNAAINPASTLNPTASNEATQNFVNNITINGNLRVSGNNVLNLAGLSPSSPARVFLNGSINIVDNGTLVLKYVRLYFIGAKGPYDRNIQLSSNSSSSHPRLNVLNTTIDSYTYYNLTIGSVYNPRNPRFPKTVYALVSYGSMINASGNSEVTAQGFSFYREKVPAQNSTFYGQTVIKCYGESSLNLTACKVDSVLAYDDARVSIYTGRGPTRIPSPSKIDSGIGFRVSNSSIVNLYGVVFKNTTLSGKAHLLLTHCTELGSNTITTMDQSRAEIVGGTVLTCTLGGSYWTPYQGAPNAKFIQTYIPGVNASGDSYASLSSSILGSSLPQQYQVAYVHDNATFAVLQNCTVSGTIITFDHSRVFLNNSLTGLVIMAIESHNFSSVSIFHCGFSYPAINLYDESSLSMNNANMSFGWIKFFNDTTAYVSKSTLTASKILPQDDANVTVVGGSDIADSVEMRGNARLSLKYSSASVIHCLDSSQVSFVNASVSQVTTGDSPVRLQARNSTLKELSFSDSNVTGSFAGLTNFFENSTLALKGSSAHASLLMTTVNGLDFAFSGYSNVTISNSTIRNLSLQGSSLVTLNNASVSSGIYLLGNSRVAAYSPLRVRSVDYFGNPLNGSVVTIETGYAGTVKVLEKQETDQNGWASFLLYSEMDNATGNFPFGSVTVAGSFGGASTSRDINLALINKDVTLSFPLPSWSAYILPVIVLVVIVALLILTYYAVKRIRGRKE